ncbi:hypothetical protein GOBAR_AA05123 [Gossypium barbadense]|uniref:RRM domain-containing protein n=1 Tax=Gossypium barbadense TaxID=3634 RepID=A0A2P5YIQ4_GOSBA|nr:hypothetical protein GOBAR_AA05123 [Gossypium barbadense]
MASRSSRTIYVGNLPLDVKEWEIEDLFYKYGHILDIELKLPSRPPGFCFVEFEDPLDAEDAIRGRDGYNFDGCRIRPLFPKWILILPMNQVELAHGGRGQSSRHDYGGGSSRGGRGRFSVSHRSEFRVVVRGLPSSASWQDLKDHMRKAGDVCFTEVHQDGDDFQICLAMVFPPVGAMGIVDYTNYDDMKYAIRKLDDSEFRNPFARAYIRVNCYEAGPRRGRSQSRSHIKSPRGNQRSVSKSRSPSPARLSSHFPLRLCSFLHLLLTRAQIKVKVQLIADKKLDAYYLFIGKYQHTMIKTFKQFSGFVAVAGMFAEWLASVEFPVDL